MLRSPAWFCVHFALVVGRLKIESWLLITVLLSAASIPLLAQQHRFTQIMGTSDQGVVTPQEFPFSARQDAAAVNAIRAYRSAVGVSAWSDLRATGEWTLNSTGSDGANEPEQATLWMRDQREFRLDVRDAQGMSSLRMDGVIGMHQHADGRMQPMDARDAIAGLFAFPMLLTATFPPAGIMLIDQGSATVDGVPLHRVTMESPWPGNPTDAKGNPLVTVTDFYFSPQSNLLIKSAHLIRGADPSPQQMLSVTTYGDYRQEEGMQVAHTYRASLNGQVMWTLHLSQVRLNQGVTRAHFHF
jgi:hypothetical protein